MLLKVFLVRDSHNFGIVWYQELTCMLQPLKKWKMKPFEILVIKEENAGNQRFLLFSQCFLHFLTKIWIFWPCYFFFLSIDAFHLDCFKNFVILKRIKLVCNLIITPPQSIDLLEWFEKTSLWFSLLLTCPMHNSLQLFSYKLYLFILKFNSY